MINNETTVTIAATGNDCKSHDLDNAYLRVSGGSGNTWRPEVHLMLHVEGPNGLSSQAWFLVEELRAALDAAVGTPLALARNEAWALGYAHGNQRAEEQLAAMERLASHPLPLHRTTANHGVTCAICDGVGCPDCTDPA